MKDVTKSVNGGRDKLGGDVFISHWVFGVAVRVELAHNSHSPWVIPGMANGKLKTSEH